MDANDQQAAGPRKRKMTVSEWIATAVYLFGLVYFAVGRWVLADEGLRCDEVLGVCIFLGCLFVLLGQYLRRRALTSGSDPLLKWGLSSVLCWTAATALIAVIYFSGSNGPFAVVGLCLAMALIMATLIAYLKFDGRLASPRDQN